MTCDHLMGYPPAASEDFQAPCWWEYVNDYPCGVPTRMRDAWGDAEGCSTSPGRRSLVRGMPGRFKCMTDADVRGVQERAATEPAAAAVTEAAESLLVTVGQDCTAEPEGVNAAKQPWVQPVVRTLELRDEPATLSEASRWPFAGQGGRNEPQVYEAMWHEQRRLEKIKAAEHQRRLAAKGMQA